MSQIRFGELLPTPQDISNEWYTPAKYCNAARVVMNGIDLDPASCEQANGYVKATRYYTQEQNGLYQDWTCQSMWLNPPFGNTPNGKSNIAIWSQHLIAQYAQGHVKQAILLCMSNTEALWFTPLWNYVICFPCPRVLFHRPDGSLDHHVQGTCFVYLGPNESAFIEVFSQFGRIAKAVDVPAKPTFTMQSLWDTEALWNVPTKEESEGVA